MLDLTWWQVMALVGAAGLAVFGGRLLGHSIHRLLYRRVLLSRTSATDDRLVLRLSGPLDLLAIVVVWHAALSLFRLPGGVMEFCRTVGNVGLLLGLAWGAARMIDTGIELFAIRSTWVTNQRVAHSLMPLARRIVKTVLGVIVGVMLLAKLGYAIGPLLVLLAIVGGAVALAARHPLENVMAAYAILADHGIREGDTVSLGTETIGTIEAIGLYSTRLRTLNGTAVIVPNRKLADAQIERAYQRAATRPLAAVSAPDTTTLSGLS